MQASIKEKACIDIAYRIRKCYEDKEIKKVKAIDGIFYTPWDHLRFFLKQDDFYKELQGFKLILAIILLTILYPVIFIMAFIFNGWPLIKDRNHINNRIKKIHEKYWSGYEMSENKTFLQLWSDKGLRDSGIGFMDYGPYTYQEKFDCLSQWIHILYDEKFDLKKFEEEIERRENEREIEFLRKNPHMEVFPNDPIDMIPFSIDALFNNYIDGKYFYN